MRGQQAHEPPRRPGHATHQAVERIVTATRRNLRHACLVGHSSRPLTERCINATKVEGYPPPSRGAALTSLTCRGGGARGTLRTRDRTAITFH